MNLNFILGCRSNLEIYVPLLFLAQQRRIKCHIFYRDTSNQFLNPALFLDPIKKLCQAYEAELHSIEEIKNHPGVTFVVEGDILGRSPSALLESSLHLLNDSYQKIVLTQNCNFLPFFSKYIDLVDYVIFPSRIYAEHNGLLHDKNRYFGNPKYSYPCFALTKEQIYRKYGLQPNQKHIMFFTPKSKFRRRSHGTQELAYCFKLYHYLMNECPEYKIIVKTRSNTVDEQALRGDYFFIDYQLFPNISVELLQVADLAVMFSSCANEECVVTETPYLQFEIDKEFDRFTFLNDPSFSRVLDFSHSLPEIKEIIDQLVAEPNKKFNEIHQKYMFDLNASAENIINWVETL